MVFQGRWYLFWVFKDDKMLESIEEKIGNLEYEILLYLFLKMNIKIMMKFQGMLLREEVGEEGGVLGVRGGISFKEKVICFVE